MKRNRWAALLCAALCAMPLSGCSDALTAARIEAGTHTADAAAEEPSEAFLRSLADFTAKTAAEILPEAGEGENALYSPASLYLALAMTADTAAGETQAQMRALLGAKDADSLRAEAGNWYRSLCYDLSEDAAYRIPAAPASAQGRRYGRDPCESGDDYTGRT